ncbi:MAG: hypothetical protein WBK19_00400 [Azonexus sp.]
MKNNRTIIATCIVALFASSPVFAKESQQFHEDDWSTVRSYGKVLISQDSVDSWGAWTDFVEPAAGGPNVNPAQLLGAGSGDSYRNNPIVTPTTVSDTCAAGSWCGYAIFRDSTTTKTGHKEKTIYEGSGYNKYSSGLFALTLTPDNFPLPKKGSPGEASWNLESLNPAITPNFTSSDEQIAVNFGGGLSNELNHFHTAGWNADPSVSGFSHSGLSIEALLAVGFGKFEEAITGTLYKVGQEPVYNRRGHFIGWQDIYVTLKADPDVAIGTFDRSSVESYTSGEGKGSTTTTTTTTTGYYVAGIATPQAYLDSQRAGNVSATYVGGSFDGSQQGKVIITVNFQPGTWSGNWSNNGSFNFNAAGTVSGANITGNVVDTKNLQGSVNGTFYGQTAGSIGGASSVQNINTAAVQNAIFLVNKAPTPVSSPK